MLTLQAAIGKTRDDGRSEAYSHPKRAAYHSFVARRTARFPSLGSEIPVHSLPTRQRNVEKLDLLLFQFAKAGKFSRLILSKEPGNVLLRVSYKWAIGYDWVSLGLSRV
jgi:hypothetical protein